MAIIETVYSGSLRTRSKHLASGMEITTDAPLDNKGKGEAFSPTDLLACSLGNCMLTLMGIACETHHMNMDGTTLSVTKMMAADPRRVSGIRIVLKLPPNNFSDHQKLILERAALTCPVAKSLHPDIIQDVTFIYL